MYVTSVVAAPWFEEEGATIARGLRRRDPRLLDSLIEKYQHRLLRYLVYLTANREFAEDLFQETWIRVLERGAQYNGKSRFETWLFAIARHLVIDSSRRKSAVSLDAITDSGGEHVGRQFSSHTPSPFDYAHRQQEGSRMETALKALEVVQREVIVLRFQEELALEEIATITGAPLSTVKSRLYRGLQALRPVLESQALESVSSGGCA
jgi:RNA polymerase sigma-70 factor (ECF subfamily)